MTQTETKNTTRQNKWTIAIVVLVVMWIIGSVLPSSTPTDHCETDWQMNKNTPSLAFTLHQDYINNCHAADKIVQQLNQLQKDHQ